MIKILIIGANGKMGKKVKENAIDFPQIKIIGGIDLNENLTDKNFPIFKDFDKLNETPDVVIDFSSPASLNKTLKFIKENSVKAVLCSTGYDEKDIKNISEASKKTAIFQSANMSLGINVLLDLIKTSAKTLYGFDIEIIETHHNEKKDAPSGTALMLAEEIQQVAPEKFFVYGRNGVTGARNKNEIGIHAIRGGNIVGKHEVIFAGNSETITLSHEATDRAVFAIGALKAAEYISAKTTGLFNMSDMIHKT